MSVKGQRIFVIFLGVLFLISGICFKVDGDGYKEIKPYCTATTKATVVDWERKTGSTGRSHKRLYAKVWEYTINGNTFAYTSDSYGNRSILGRHSIVHYNHDDTTMFYIDAEVHQRSLFNFIFIGASIFLILLGLFGKIQTEQD